MVDLPTIINELIESYNNIDIRGVGFFAKNENKWYCSFLRILFTKEKADLINEEYSTIMKNSDIPNDEIITIFYECKSINSVDILLEQIKNKRIILKEREYIIITDKSADILNPDLCISKDGSQFYKTKIDSTYDYRIFTINFIDGDAFNFIFEKYNINLKEHGIEDFNEFPYYLGINRMDYNDNIVLIFPLYFQPKQPILNNSMIIDCISINKNLKNKLRTKVTSNINYNTFVKNVKPEYEDTDEEFIKGCIRSSEEISESDTFNIKISLGKLENIKEYNVNGFEIIRQLSLLKPKTQVNKSLLTSFKKYTAFEFFRQNFHVKDDSIFVGLISQLLSLFNFAAINLGYFEKDGEQPIDKNNINSADILAYYEPEEKFFVVDCTVSIPSIQKINKIYSTSQFLTKTSNNSFLPIIFSQEEVRIRNDATKAGVIIFDKLDIELLLNLIDSDNICELKNTFRQKLLFPQDDNNIISDDSPSFENVI